MGFEKLGGGAEIGLGGLGAVAAGTGWVEMSSTGLSRGRLDIVVVAGN